MSVSAIIVTRGDVDLEPVARSLPEEWEIVVWNNGEGKCVVVGGETHEGFDRSVHGRYAAITYASNDLIYVQDDDCIVSDPRRLVHVWMVSQRTAREDPQALLHESPDNLCEIGAGRHIVCNMPKPFRHDFYTDHALVGFGAVFQRDVPERAIDRWYGTPKEIGVNGDWGLISRTCDIIVTGLTPRILVDVPYENLPHAYADNRMYRQEQHVGERTRMRELVAKVRDA